MIGEGRAAAVYLADDTRAAARSRSRCSRALPARTTSIRQGFRRGMRHPVGHPASSTWFACSSHQAGSRAPLPGDGVPGRGQPARADAPRHRPRARLCRCCGRPRPDWPPRIGSASCTAMSSPRISCCAVSGELVLIDFGVAARPGRHRGAALRPAGWSARPGTRRPSRPRASRPARPPTSTAWASSSTRCCCGRRPFAGEHRAGSRVPAPGGAGSALARSARAIPAADRPHAGKAAAAPARRCRCGVAGNPRAWRRAARQ